MGAGGALGCVLCPANWHMVDEKTDALVVESMIGMRKMTAAEERLWYYGRAQLYLESAFRDMRTAYDELLGLRCDENMPPVDLEDLFHAAMDRARDLERKLREECKRRLEP